MLRNIFPYSRAVEINYEVEGHGPIPVVFVHGFAASLVTWHDIRKFFPKDRFRLFLLDLKGFGFSSKPRDDSYSVTDQADIIIAFVKALGLRNVVLIGHSFGGGVTLQAVLKSGQNYDSNPIGKLILLNSAAYPQRLPLLMRILRRPLPAMALMRIFPTNWIVYWTLKRIFCNQAAITHERISRYTGCFSRRDMAYVLIRTVKQLIAGESGTRRDYRMITIPTLIIWGREDHVTELRQAYRLHGEIEGSRLEILDGCGHNPHEEYPEKTYALISDFIGVQVL